MKGTICFLTIFWLALGLDARSIPELEAAEPDPSWILPTLPPRTTVEYIPPGAAIVALPYRPCPEGQRMDNRGICRKVL
ncbi:hypothetical protein WN55_09863 [Dufourea novaeangliae]|uniref:Secapin n=1 Tax=Dufourea novaeangliae TaxID=178035 RepID=A0A154P7M2_DUFNO|nr:hypothetical protein WN55_09863 [Dufourea novaeangliae]